MAYRYDVGKGKAVINVIKAILEILFLCGELVGDID